MILDKAVMEVDIKTRLDFLKMRRKPPLIYHAFNVSNIDATVNIQIKPIYNITKDNAIPIVNSIVMYANCLFTYNNLTKWLLTINIAGSSNIGVAF